MRELRRRICLAGSAALLLTGLVAGGCGDDDDDDTGQGVGVQTQTGGEGEGAEQGDTADRTAIPGQGTGGGAGAGGGVPQGNATPPASGSPGQGGAGATATTAPGRGPAEETEQAELASDLSSALQGHVYLTGMMAEAIRDGDMERTDAVMTELEQDTRALSQTMGQLGADEAQFTELWNLHLLLYRQYADAMQQGNDGAAEDASNQLASWATDFAGFAAGVAPALGVDNRGEQILRTHVEETQGAIDATLANDPIAVQLVRHGATGMADFGKLLLGLGTS